jgi:hypothetical protein
MKVGKKVKEWDLPKPIKITLPEPDNKPIEVEDWPIREKELIPLPLIPDKKAIL